MDVSYHLLLEDISKRQNLGLLPQEMPLIIHTQSFDYYMAFLCHEDENYVSFITVDEQGQEFAKIVKKQDIECIEVIYSQMLQNDKEEIGDVMYV